ncbi:MAG: hypothetical protein ACLGHQ_03635 [Acidimicrobiia bacterium]
MQLQPRTEIDARGRVDDAPPCVSCGSSTAVWFSTPEGRARLCPPCATLHGLGCP